MKCYMSFFADLESRCNIVLHSQNLQENIHLEKKGYCKVKGHLGLMKVPTMVGDKDNIQQI